MVKQKQGEKIKCKPHLVIRKKQVTMNKNKAPP